MIFIEKIYDPKDEFKRLYKSLRYMSKQSAYQSPKNKKYLEVDMTEIIDDYVQRWKFENMNPITHRQLHRFAIAYRHNTLQGTK